MKILVYNATAQAKIGAKTNPEPWMHVVITNNNEFAIFIWDTREVLETGKCAKDIDFTGCENARDNHKELKNLPEGMEVNFKELPKVPRFKVFKDDKGRIGCYRHGYVAIIENGKVVEVKQIEGYKTIADYLKANPDCKKATKDDEAILPILDAVKALKAGENKIHLFDTWYNLK
jgi:hypothetical protein